MHVVAAGAILLAPVALGAPDLDVASVATIRAHNSSLFWGTYRPNLYFGTRTRTPESLLTGLMWFGVGDLQSGAWQKIRHTCEQGDELSGYAWQKHDGRTFGTQEIKDNLNNITIKTEFLKRSGGDHGGDWVVRITGTPFADHTSDVSMLFYTGLDGNGQFAEGETDDEIDLSDHRYRKRDPAVWNKDGSVIFRGASKDLGDFAFVVVDGPDNKPPPTGPYPPTYELPKVDHTRLAKWALPKGRVWQIKDALLPNMVDAPGGARQLVQLYKDPMPSAAELLLAHNQLEGNDPNVYIVQKTLRAPFQFDIVFLSQSARDHDAEISFDDAKELSGPSLTNLLKSASKNYDDRFEKQFNLASKGYNKDEIAFAQSLLGNMVGGLGYFHGTQIVDRALEGHEEDSVEDFPETEEEDEEEDDYFGGGSRSGGSGKPQPKPQQEGPFSLFTAVPSRPFFPRGFLWDEGFHQLLVGAWDNDLSLDILSHWASLIDEKGWVAREQILGDEARSKVPQEFQTQYPHFANPPTLILAVSKYIERLRAAREHPEVTIDETNTIASTSDLNILTRGHLIDQTLATSYLDNVYEKFKTQYSFFRRTQWGNIEDYGRNPKGGEGYRWRGRTNQHTLTSGLDDYPRASPPHEGELHVDLISWVAFYARTLRAVAEEIGREGDVKRFLEDEGNLLRSLDELHWNEKSQSYCDVSVDDNGDSYHLVHKGYISLFPFLLGLLPPDHPHLGAILDMLRDEKHLWTPYGLASLSKSDEFYGTSENYWRGPVWINVNYLALGSLYKNYMNKPGPQQAKAQKIYKELRENIISNVYKEYKRTGYVWEQYSSVDGEGKRSHPFTGWTALVTLIMAEQY
ncbi:Processing alpha glucosidase I [Rhizophlyctis rosea]|nr:Processing alpha glucosidase I [Rhizophlyctis rosea]